MSRLLHVLAIFVYFSCNRLSCIRRSFRNCLIFDVAHVYRCYLYITKMTLTAEGLPWKMLQLLVSLLSAYFKKLQIYRGLPASDIKILSFTLKWKERFRKKEPVWQHYSQSRCLHKYRVCATGRVFLTNITVNCLLIVAYSFYINGMIGKSKQKALCCSFMD